MTPSPGSARNASNSSIADGGVIDHKIAQTSTPGQTLPSTDTEFSRPRQLEQRQLSATSSSNDRNKDLKDVVPYFAGKSMMLIDGDWQ